MGSNPAKHSCPDGGIHQSLSQTAKATPSPHASPQRHNTLRISPQTSGCDAGPIMSGPIMLESEGAM